MKLLTEEPAGAFAINAYGPHFFQIGSLRHESSVLLLPDAAAQRWQAPAPALWQEHDFALLLDCRADVVLIGTGPRQHFLNATLARALRARGLPVEAMATPAACRTYNILLSEGRRLAAALWLEDPADRAAGSSKPVLPA